jgi:hypothetical protein
MIIQDNSYPRNTTERIRLYRAANRIHGIDWISIGSAAKKYLDILTKPIWEEATKTTDNYNAQRTQHDEFDLKYNSQFIRRKMVASWFWAYGHSDDLVVGQKS